MSLRDNAVWFITGCSTGLGRALALYLLENGYRVVVTARDPKQLDEVVKKFPGRALSVKLDVTNNDEISAAIEQTQSIFGDIDVLVNNAGIGYLGAIEESDEQAARYMFEVNFWGLSAMTRAVLPQMRRRRAGYIINLSSMAGLRGGAGIGYYNATKFAVEGFSEALAKELAPLGIKTLLVEPSGFRTDWAGRSASEAELQIDDYNETAGAKRQQIRQGSGRQPGDPVRAAEAILAAIKAEDPPLRLLLGKNALAAGRGKISEMTTDFEKWAEVSENADFPVH